MCSYVCIRQAVPYRIHNDEWWDMTAGATDHGISDGTMRNIGNSEFLRVIHASGQGLHGGFRPVRMIKVTTQIFLSDFQ